MKRFVHVVLSLTLISAVSLPALARQFVQCSVRIDGQKTFKVDSIYPNQKVYLEVNGLASAMGWRATPVNSGRAVRLNGKVFNDLKDYERRTYVSADELGSKLGYDVKTTNRGLVVDFWTRSGASASSPNLDLRVVKEEKTTSPNPEYDMYKLTVELKNPSSAPTRVNARNFVVVDDDGGRHKCEGSFDIGVPAKDSVKVERVYFSVPRMSMPKELQLLDKQNQVVGKTRM